MKQTKKILRENVFYTVILDANKNLIIQIYFLKQNIRIILEQKIYSMV